MSDRSAMSWEARDRRSCPLCSSVKTIKLGIRGNREFLGASQAVKPHVFTHVVRCKTCGFIFCDPVLPEASNLEGAYYENAYPEISNLEHKVSRKYRVGLSRIMNYKKQGLFLDVGAGIGGAVSLASSKGFTAIGVEPSLKSCDYGNKSNNLQIFPGYLRENYPAHGMCFDVISLFHVLEHAEKPEELLLLVKKRLCSTGIVYIEVPNGDSLLLGLIDVFYSLFGKKWSSRLSPLHPPFHSVAFCPKSLRYLLQREGFEILELKTFTHYSSFRTFPTVKLTIIELIRFSLSFLLSFLPNGEVVYVIASKSQ